MKVLSPTFLYPQSWHIGTSLLPSKSVVLPWPAVLDCWTVFHSFAWTAATAGGLLNSDWTLHTDDFGWVLWQMLSSAFLWYCLLLVKLRLADLFGHSLSGSLRSFGPNCRLLAKSSLVAITLTLYCTQDCLTVWWYHLSTSIRQCL